MKKVMVYTDGACSGNPGPGGWGCILVYGDVSREISGGVPNTTNNRMELTAAIEALRRLKEPCEVHLHTDSAYLCRAFNEGWIDGWLKNDWRGSYGKAVSNRDLWEKLIAFSEVHKILWIKVPGHKDNVLNNRCDKLARDAVRQQKNI